VCVNYIIGIIAVLCRPTEVIVENNKPPFSLNADNILSFKFSHHAVANKLVLFYIQIKCTIKRTNLSVDDRAGPSNRVHKLLHYKVFTQFGDYFAVEYSHIAIF